MKGELQIVSMVIYVTDVSVTPRLISLYLYTIFGGRNEIYFSDNRYHVIVSMFVLQNKSSVFE
jgi:hypothetical protein